MSQNTDIEEIRNIEYAMASAQTLDDCLQCWHKDVVQIDIMPGALVGIEAVRESLAPQFAGCVDIRCDINDLKIVVDGNMGYAHSTMVFTANGNNGGPYGNAGLFDAKSDGRDSVHMSWRQTDIYRKEDGRWQLVHQHSSFPIDRKTGQAIIVPQA